MKNLHLLTAWMTKTAAVTCGALLLGITGFATSAVAQDRPEPGPNLDEPPADRPAVTADDNVQRPRGPRMERDWQAWRPERGRAFDRPDGFRGPRARAEWAPGEAGYGPKQGERGFRQGPPRDRRGPDGYSPPRGERGFREGPPPGRFDADGNRQGPPPRGFHGRGPGRTGVDGPRGPVGPPRFEAMDADGDGAITKAEYDAFHAERRASRPQRGPRSPRPGADAPGDLSGPPPARRGDAPDNVPGPPPAE